MNTNYGLAGILNMAVNNMPDDLKSHAGNIAVNIATRITNTIEQTENGEMHNEITFGPVVSD